MTHSDIMIVDDNPANLKLLEDMLRQRGHEVRAFPLGRLALAAAAKNLPDLILLDIDMPEMNGYEVCRRLKSAAPLSGVPVIFLSALNDVTDKVKAFRAGAVDYISKPFQFEEVHARVATHITVHSLQQELQRQNERLEDAVAARTRELDEANGRLKILDRSKNDFLQLISHELRTPLNGVLGISDLLLDKMDCGQENGELRRMFDRSRERLVSLLDDALLLTEIDVSTVHFRFARICVEEALKLAIDKTKEFAASRRVAIVPPPPCAAVILGDQVLLVRALHGLLETAVQFARPGGAIRLSHEAAADACRIVVESCGRTIPDSVLPKFFDLFAVTESDTQGQDLGLRPAVAHGVLSLFGGSVAVANQKDQSGISLTISLKTAS